MPRFILITLLLTFTVLAAKTQDGQQLNTADKHEEVPFGTIQTMPYLLLKTGDAANIHEYRKQSQQLLQKFFYSHLRYPAKALNGCVSGTVVISFIVDANGLIERESIRCIRDIGAGCGAEAKRVVTLMADLSWRWVPVKQLGVPVPIQYYYPVKFRLE